MQDAAPSDPPPVPTYYRDVASILAKHCTTCHSEGGVGPFPLTSYIDAYETSGAIADLTARRVMPPWPADASGACNTFVAPRWLDDRSIATLAAWDAAGAPAGDPTDLPRIPASLTTPFTTAVVLGSDAPYVVLPGPDEYRCFVVDPGLAADRFITGIQMQLDRADVVHHMQLFAADHANAEQMIIARDAADPGPGYACDQEGVGTGLRYIGVWAAGDLIRRWPAGTGIEVFAGRRLVVQLHYHNHGSQPVVDQTRVALELAESVDAVGAIQGASAYPLQLPPGQPDITVEKTQALSLQFPKLLRAARVHMHLLGSRARMELVRGGQTSCVLDIPRWDFGWQLFYSFAQPIAVEPGDQLRIRCSYDTTSRTGTTTWGVGTEDEMCIGYAYLTD